MLGPAQALRSCRRQRRQLAVIMDDCPDEKFKGALASKVSYDQASRQISISVVQSIFAGKMSADGKALDT